MTWSQRKYDIPVEDGRTHLERMRAGDWFKYRAGPELAELQMVTKRGCREASALYWDDPEAATLQLGGLLLECGPGLDWRPVSDLAALPSVFLKAARLALPKI